MANILINSARRLQVAAWNRWPQLAMVGGILLVSLLVPMVIRQVGAGEAFKLMLLAAVASGVGLLVLWQPFTLVLILAATAQQQGIIDSPIVQQLMVAVSPLLVLALAVERKRNRQAARSRSFDLEFAVLLIGSITIAWMLSEREFLPLTELGSHGRRVTQLISLILLSVLISRLTNTVWRVRALMLAIVFSTALSAAVTVSDAALGTSIGIADYGESVAEVENRTDDVRLAGTSWNPSQASQTMAIGSVISALFAIYWRRHRVLLLGVAFLSAAAVIATAGRAGMLILALFVLWLPWRFRREPKTLAYMMMGLLLVALLPLLTPSKAQERTASLATPTEDGSTQFRLAQHFVGLDQLWTHPLFGIGPTAFGATFHSYPYRWVAEIAGTGRPLQERHRQGLHNMYLGIAVEYGLVALFALAGLIAAGILSADRARKRGPPELGSLAEAAEIALLLFLVAAALGPDLVMRFFWILLGLALAFNQFGGLPDRRKLHAS